MGNHVTDTCVEIIERIAGDAERAVRLHDAGLLTETDLAEYHEVLAHAADALRLLDGRVAQPKEEKEK